MLTGLGTNGAISIMPCFGKKPIDWQKWNLSLSALPAELVSQRKFEEIKKADQAAARKLVEEHCSSSEEEGDEDLEGKQGKIVANTFISYTTHTGISLPVLTFFAI